MTILCIHGSYGSVDKFKVQVGTLVDAIEKAGPIEFKWLEGAHATTPPENFESYFGPPPWLRHFEYDGVSALDTMITKIRDFPAGLSAEDTIRRLVSEESMSSKQAVMATMDRMIKVLDEDPSIDGVLGYSEGATLAATMVLEEQRRFEEEGRPRHLNHAIFLAGWPPLRLVNGNVECVLADECEDLIDIPTCHIIGCNDPYIHGAMALFGVCDDETATLFDHGKGHTVPRDPTTIQELAQVVHETRNQGKHCPWVKTEAGH